MLRILFISILGSLALAACRCDKPSIIDAGTPDAGPALLDEKEPNNGPEGALLIDRSSLVNANLGADSSKIDEDWYRLESQRPATADVVVNPPSSADVAIEVVDEARTVLTAINSAGVGGAERLPNLHVNGRVFLRIVGVKKGAGGAYTLRISYKEADMGFEHEPNERRVDATTVALGSPISGFIGHMGDEDWFRFELPNNAGAEPTPTDAALTDAGAAPTAAVADASVDAGVSTADASVTIAPSPQLALRIDLSGVEGVRSDLSVLTEAEAVLFNAKSAPGAGLSLRNIGVRANDRVIYVVIKSSPIGTGKEAKRGSSTDVYYTLTVAPEEAGATSEFEPNDISEKATELPLEGYREGFLSPKGDVDYYRLTAPTASLAKVSVSGVEKVDLQLSMVKVGEKEEVLLKANDGAVKEPEMLNNVSCAPICVFKVEAAARKVDGKLMKDDENGDMPYRITVSTVADDGSEEREPNNTAETAMPIQMGQPVRGTIYPKRDIDLLKLDMTSRQVKTPIKATLHGVLKVDVALLLHRLEDGKLELVGTADKGKGDATETMRMSLDPGTYLFEVRDTKNREANFQDSWQLTVDEADE